MPQENENQVDVEEVEAEQPQEEVLPEGVDADAEEKKQNWPVVILGIIVALLIVCSGMVCVAGGIAALTGGKQAGVVGTVIYRERMALAPDAVVNVQIQDVSRADAPADVIGEQVIKNPGQVPIPFAVAYKSKDIQDNHTYVARAEIRDGSGKLLFTSTQHYPVITRGAPTEDVQIVVERVSAGPQPTPPPAAKAYIQIDEPVYGATLELNTPVTVSGQGGALPEGNVVVQALDRDGNVLAEQYGIIQAPDAGSGGEGPWSVQLVIKTEPGTAGTIYAFARSPLENSLMAEDSVEVSLGRTEAKPTFLEINEPAEGAALDTANPIQVSGTGGGLPEGNVVVRALDDNDKVLAEQATILQGDDVSSGGAGTWSVQLIVGAIPGTTGRIVAFSPSPTDGGYVASAVVNISYGISREGGLEDTAWVLSKALPGTEVTALFQDGQVSGSAGCNNYSGSYATDHALGKNTIKIGPLASTMMMCQADIMDQETQYLTALQSATSYQVEGNVLTLSYPGGVLVFQGNPVR